jgi:hypothetical protein
MAETNAVTSVKHRTARHRIGHAVELACDVRALKHGAVDQHTGDELANRGLLNLDATPDLSAHVLASELLLWMRKDRRPKWTARFIGRTGSSRLSTGLTRHAWKPILGV